MADVKDKDRQSRLAAALRENLKRRKAQLRARAGGSLQDAADRPDDGTADATSDVQGEGKKPA